MLATRVAATPGTSPTTTQSAESNPGMTLWLTMRSVARLALARAVTQTTRLPMVVMLGAQNLETLTLEIQTLEI